MDLLETLSQAKQLKEDPKAFKTQLFLMHQNEILRKQMAAKSALSEFQKRSSQTLDVQEKTRFTKLPMPDWLDEGPSEAFRDAICSFEREERLHPIRDMAMKLEKQNGELKAYWVPRNTTPVKESPSGSEETKSESSATMSIRNQTKSPLKDKGESSESENETVAEVLLDMKQMDLLSSEPFAGPQIHPSTSLERSSTLETTFIQTTAKDPDVEATTKTKETEPSFEKSSEVEDIEKKSEILHTEKAEKAPEKSHPPQIEKPSGNLRAKEAERAFGSKPFFPATEKTTETQQRKEPEAHFDATSYPIFTPASSTTTVPSCFELPRKETILSASAIAGGAAFGQSSMPRYQFDTQYGFGYVPPSNSQNSTEQTSSMFNSQGFAGITGGFAAVGGNTQNPLPGFTTGQSSIFSQPTSQPPSSFFSLKPNQSNKDLWEMRK